LNRQNAETPEEESKKDGGRDIECGTPCSRLCQLSLIELGQVCEKFSRDLIPPSHDARKARQEFIVRQ